MVPLTSSPDLIGRWNRNFWSTWTICMVSMPTSTCWKKCRWIITAKIDMKVSGAMSAP